MGPWRISLVLILVVSVLVVVLLDGVFQLKILSSSAQPKAYSYDFTLIKNLQSKAQLCGDVDGASTPGCYPVATAQCRDRPWSDQQIFRYRYENRNKPDPILAKKTFVLFFISYTKTLSLEEFLFAKLPERTYMYQDKNLAFIPYLVERCFVLEMQCIFFTNSLDAASVTRFKYMFPWAEIAPLPQVPHWASRVCPAVHSQRLGMLHTLLHADPRFNDAFLIMNDLDSVWHYHPALSFGDWTNNTVAMMRVNGNANYIPYMLATKPSGADGSLIDKYLRLKPWEMQIVGGVIWGHSDALRLWCQRLQLYFESTPDLGKRHPVTSTPDMLYVTWLNWMYYANSSETKTYLIYQLLDRGGLQKPPQPFTQHYYACCENFQTKLLSGLHNCFVCDDDAICHCLPGIPPVTTRE